MDNLKIRSGATNAWYLYKNNKLLLGSHDKELLEKVKMMLDNDGKCNHTKSERIGETKLWCCNICGSRIEDF